MGSARNRPRRKYRLRSEGGPVRVSRLLAISCLLLAAAFGISAHGYSSPATLYLTLDTGAGDAAFQSVVYVQNVKTGTTLSFPYPPHAPPLLVYVPEPGTYVFYARLVEAMDDYYFGCTGKRGKDGSPRKGLLAVDIEAGKEYHLVINDRSVKLPEKGKPVTVTWHR